MGILEDKISEMVSEDAALRVVLEESGAIAPLLGASRQGLLGAGEETVDLTLVPRDVIARAKSIIHSELPIPAPFTYEGILITITELSLDGDMLRVVVAADCPLDNPYNFVNAPLQKVAQEAVYSDTEVDETGMPLLISPRVTEDAPDEVLQTIVGQAVHGVAVARGWRG